MFTYEKDLHKIRSKEGILLERLGACGGLSAVHWNMSDGAIVDLHHHPQEQFGYIIQGALEVTIGAETQTLRAGEAYFIPADVPHMFIARGETEAIDVFTPIRIVLGEGESNGI